MSNPDPNARVPAADAAPIAPALLEAELRRITASPLFRQAARHRQMLLHLVARAQCGDTAALKETVLAVELFRRPAGQFDPVRDSIVRVEARRLRQRLQRYYAADGHDAALEISLPVGSYVPTLRHRDAPRPAATQAARDLVERGYHFLRAGGEESLRKALQRFDAALREDADYAPAYLGAARAWMNLVAEVYQPPLPWVDHATEALQRSLDLEPDNAEALTLLAATLHRYQHDWPAAERLFQRAIALVPRLAFAHLGYGTHLGLAGQPDRAEAELKLARDLDPQYLNTRWQMAMLRVGQRRFADARKEIDTLLDLSPNHLAALHMIGALALFTGRPHDALAQYRHLDAIAPQHPIGLVGVAQALGALGEREHAQHTVERLRERFAGLYIAPYQYALIELRRGEHDAALHWLEEAATTRDSNTIYALTDPALDDLRSDARFAQFLRRHRLVDAGA